MFEDILPEEDPKPFVFGPSYIHVMYFKDGEGYEYDVNITSEELLNALPLMLPYKPTYEKAREIIEHMKHQLLLRKCLLMESNVV